MINKNEIESRPLNEEETIYKENILDHYKHPRNKREIKKPTIKHKESNIVCGDEITIYLKIKNNIIDDVSFTGKGCAISLSSISMLTEKLKGMKLKEAKKLKNEDIFNLLGIPISYQRTKCALLSLKALQRGLENEKA